MRKYLHKFFLLVTIVMLFFLWFNIDVAAKTELDMSDVHWNESEFIYDNTVKTVFLENVPKEITVKYSQNQGSQVKTYTAHAVLEYDQNLYTLINYNAKMITVHVWEIKIGTIPFFTFTSKSFLEDDRYHSLEISNLPENVEVIYSENNYQKDPGKYYVRAEFVVPEYYQKVEPKYAWLTILKKKIETEEKDVSLISSIFGFDPDITVSSKWQTDLTSYESLDLTSVGSFREVKAAFSIDLSLNDSLVLLEHPTVIRVKIPSDILDARDLMVCEYGTKILTDVHSNQSNDELVFETNNLSDVYLIIGRRDTYTSNQVWKVWLIVLMCGIFVIGLSIIVFIYKKRRSFR